MEMEQQRGISISAAALEFELDGHHVTLLDTPGHQDFSEDTYRTLLAVDSVVMVLDAAKGVEPQTLKLFEVCRAHGLPVLTFVNKLDQPALDRFELLDQIERVLGIAGRADELAARRRPGLQGRLRPRSQRRAASTSARRRAAAPRRWPWPAPNDPEVAELIGDKRQQDLIDAVDIITGAGTRFDPEAYRRAKQTPVFFGSALNDFGVEPFLQALLDLAPPPGPRLAGATCSSSRPTPTFSGFVFKIQANMNPRHRDRVAFVRVCSGRLSKDMLVVNTRLGSEIRLSRVYRFFGRDRETVPEAYPGDVVGIVNPGRIAIGDTLYADRRVVVPAHPAVSRRALRHAAARRGPAQALRRSHPAAGRGRAAAGVHAHARHALSDRGGDWRAAARRDRGTDGRRVRHPVQGRTARPTWRRAGPSCRRASRWCCRRAASCEAVDRLERPVLIFESDWVLRYTMEKNPGVTFSASL